MNLKQFFMPLTGLAFVSLASPSFAGDGLGYGWDYKSQSGAACQPQIGAQAGDFERHPQYIINVSETGHTVICPIVRDTVVATDLDAGVAVTTGVSCMLHVIDYTGERRLDPVGPSSGYSLDFDREIQYFYVNANYEIDLAGIASGYYAFQCTLPPGGKVFYYGAGELASTTDHGA